ncbi:histidine phosphatase family protein [Arcanobacterium phocisimile]|uniref:Histidine phosphatase family protein n=1 Tax=Arcanobacterium phocisimile TaxID=1302235 RepID=A0ABX7IE64_9ACTO|nr:histidine phosphatase family protein [Arcanobacterium phocisimile]QRV01429.1 histidine phosphatase family protein [Arcanobacterium phocisimile]
MKNLIVMRHAEAAFGYADHDRPLTDYGQSQARVMGSMLAQRFPVIDYVWVSDALRTRQTLAGLEVGGARFGQVQVSPDLYDGSHLDLVHCVHGSPPECAAVLIVAHEPGVSSVVSYLGDTSTPVTRTLMRGFSPATVGIAQMDFPWGAVEMGMLPVWEKLSTE